MGTQAYERVGAVAAQPTRALCVYVCVAPSGKPVLYCACCAIAGYCPTLEMMDLDCEKEHPGEGAPLFSGSSGLSQCVEPMCHCNTHNTCYELIFNAVSKTGKRIQKGLQEVQASPRMAQLQAPKFSRARGLLQEAGFRPGTLDNPHLLKLP